MNVRCDYIYIYHGVYLRDVIINHMKSWSFAAKSKKDWAVPQRTPQNKILPNAPFRAESWMDFGPALGLPFIDHMPMIVSEFQAQHPGIWALNLAWNRKSRASKMILLLDMALVPCSKGLYLHTGDPQPTTTPELGVLLSL